jgi:hypothetical protein
MQQPILVQAAVAEEALRPILINPADEADPES